MKFDRKFQQLMHLLENEYELVKAADFLKLTSCEVEKSKVFSEIALEDLSPDQIVQLRAVLSRNQDGLTAVAKGIRSAIEKIEKLADGATPRDYDRNGARSNYGDLPSKLDRRA